MHTQYAYKNKTDQIIVHNNTMGYNRNEGKPPLYRKVNKRTHNGSNYLYFYTKQRYRFDRDKKQDVLPEKTAIKRHNSIHRTGYDYTPLYKFLHAHVGQPWDAIYQECVSRLESPEPITYIVMNVNKRGLVTDNHPGIDLPKMIYDGIESYWSALWVDEDGLLQFVDDVYSIADDNYFMEDLDMRYPRSLTVTWNGKPVWPENAVKKEKEQLH